MGNPFPYPLCNQTVTVYRLEGDTVIRQVVTGCFYRYEDVLEEHPEGQRTQRKFLLIAPGVRLRAGDRIYDGEGPEVTAEQYSTFLPVCVPGLSQAAYATPWYWQGQLCHTEAGRK